jgi:FixJ family two-component response regulator
MTASTQSLSSVVRIVDDDISICRMVAELLTNHHLRVQSYGSAAEFFRHDDPQIPGCLITDVRMPGMSGIELQERLTERGWTIPTIVISGDLDVSLALRAMKNHAVDVLEKPFLPRVLLDRVYQALELDQSNRTAAARSEAVSRKLEAMTTRERDVFELVVAGHANKRIAALLGIAEKTVEAHRGRLMKKLGAANVVDLVHLAVQAQFSGNGGRPNPGRVQTSPGHHSSRNTSVAAGRGLAGEI